MIDFLMAEVRLTQDAHEGDTKIIVDDISHFSKEAVNNDFPTIMLMDKNTTGKRVEGGFEGTELVYIQDTYANVIELAAPLNRDWTVNGLSFARRAPGGVPVGKIIIGDVQVAEKFPFIAINPVSKAISWKTLSGTMEKDRIDFIVHVKDDDTETATELVIKVADAVEWILMSNLHIQPYGYTSTWSKTSMAMIEAVNYGTIQKGSSFLKVATISYVMDSYMFRGYLTSQGLNVENNLSLKYFGPLEA